MTLNDLLTRYVDFRSPVESRILTLWTVGTYFYTMFPAYPYLALIEPKNSGKSTGLRVLQPLAFNMLTTSDPTGSAMFRLIHYTSCTFGIDEAERVSQSQRPRNASNPRLSTHGKRTRRDSKEIGQRNC